MKVKEKIEEAIKSLNIELPSSLNLDIYKIFYLLFFLIIYISNQHSVEKQIREINKLEKEVEELRTDYVTLNNNYMFSRKESEILKRVKEIGLVNSKLPPERISNKK
ncbi:MAG: FtsL-like putative cell division protein [Cytophagales bacterium]|jgi:hypothetical protein|nr:FtsL-like putative cell division protein [Cytophagales bacterium]PDH40570.1 MAG: hypothetical protein CND83_05040 [Rhodothermaeota bacterium MED-G19]